MQRLQRNIERLRSDRGTAIVEFSIVLPLLLLLLFGIVDFAKAWNYTNDMTHIANEGARLAAVGSNPGSGSSLTLQQYIQQQAESSELKNGGTSSIPAPVIVCIDFPGGSQMPGNPVRVRVAVDYHLVPFLPNWLGWAPGVQLRGESTMRLEQPAGTYSTADNPAGCASL